MAIPTREDSIYRVSLHKNGGYTYASTHPYAIDGSGKRKYSALHWGTVVEGNRFIPGKQYLYAGTEESKRLIFPEGMELDMESRLYYTSNTR